MSDGKVEKGDWLGKEKYQMLQEGAENGFMSCLLE